MEASDFINRSGFYRRQSDSGSLKDWEDDQDGVQEIVLHPTPLPSQNKKGLFRRQPTLTLITLEEDQNRIIPRCLKITQNVAFEFLNVGIFHQFLSY